MGYEMKLYIVEECNFLIPSDGEKLWADVIAMIDICKCYEIMNVFKTEAKGYIYADDGNTRIDFDRYEEPLKSASIDEVMDALNSVRKEYDRAQIAYDILKSFKKNRPNCVVYKFGY